MSSTLKTDRPQRTLIAYCALAERLSKPGANMLQALVPFFAEACREYAGQPFDASKFSTAVKKHYGIEIPRLAALGIAEQLKNEGVLEVISGYAQNTTYKYSESIKNTVQEVTAITENDVENILQLFKTYCISNCELTSNQIDSLNDEFLERLLNIDSMRLLSRREASITTKRTSDTLQLSKELNTIDPLVKHSLHLDFLVSSFLINLRDSNAQAFDIVSNIAFANMAAEAIACFREPSTDTTDLSSLTILLDTPLILDMLGVNSEYKEYGSELLHLLQNSGCKVSVLDHSIVEAENTLHSKLGFLRSGVNQITYGSTILPNMLAALIGNVAERLQARLKISIQKDPDINLHRISQNTVGDIQTHMDSRMFAWGNEEAKNHDKKSVWSMIALRDKSAVQPKICYAGWILLTKNTPLVKIANDSWKTWLKGATNHSAFNVEKWAPVSMTDKQFAGYIWARNGGGPSSIPQTLLLAHCSAAVRPRADIKAKAYNLMLEMYGLEEAQDIVALLEDKEGGRALMQATLGDPEDMTLERIPFLMEKAKLAAGEFAAERVKADSKKELEESERLAALKLESTMKQHENEKQKLLEQQKINSQKLFAEQQIAINLNIKAENYKNELENQVQKEKNRKESILTRGFNAGLREYRAYRWLIVAIFVLISALVSTNIFDLHIVYTSILTTLIAFAGFWFVPDLMEPFITKQANNRLKKIVAEIDSNINHTEINVNYKNKSFTFIQK